MTLDRVAISGVVIDPGHGGKDFGIIDGDVVEKDLNLEVSRYIYYRLNQLGIPVSLTRDCDVDLSDEERIRRIMDAFGNKDDVIVLTNHMGNSGVGANVMYAFRNNNTLSNQIMKAIGEAGQITNSPYQRRLPSDTTKDYYFIHRLTGLTEPILIEYGNMNNTTDLNRIKNDLLTYGEGVVKAIANYAGVKYEMPNGDSSIYAVRKGDSLYSIARKFDTSVDTIVKLNTLTSNILSVGQILLIPRNEGMEPVTPSVPDASTPIETVTHTVKQGDCLYSLAREYKTTVVAIIGANNLTSSILSIGQQLIIPITGTATPTTPGLAKPPIPAPPTVPKAPAIPAEPGEVTPPVEPVVPVETSVPEETTIPASTSNYIVKRGDSLYTIANRFGVSESDIINANNLGTNLLSLGQQLKIPTTKAPTMYINYTVKKGDNIYNIASRFNTTVDGIKKASGITNNLLSLGQVLRIPR